jgi:hypothetical protein
MLKTPRTIATPDGMKRSLVIPLAILLASQAAAQIVLDEHFTDGNLSFGSDPNDGNFLRQGGTSQSISIVTDNIIGGGNALAYSNQTNGTLFIGQMQTPATLVFIGQQLISVLTSASPAFLRLRIAVFFVSASTII